MRFLEQNYLWLVALTPFLIAWFVIGEKNRRARAQKFFGNFTHFKLSHFKSAAYIITAIAVGLTAVALSRPQKPIKNQEEKSLAMDLLIVLDVSKSMLAEDIPPSRLQVAKRKIKDLLEGLPGDRVGLIAFSGSALLVTPMTTDHLVILDFLETLDPSVISNQGTAISEGLLRAKKAIEDTKTESAAVILITDAEDHEEGAIEVANELSTKGVRLYAIGIGTEKGGLIPERNPWGKFVRYKKSRDGSPIISKLSMNHLEKIANAGGGKAFASPSASALENILNTIEKMERTELESSTAEAFDDIFQIFLFPSILMLIFGLALIWRTQSIVCILPLLFFSPSASSGFFQPEWAELSNEAVELYKLKDFKKSVSLNEKALKILKEEEPKNNSALQKVHFNLGMSLILSGKTADGLESLNQALQGPDEELKAKALYNMGLTMAHMKKLPEAKKALVNSIITLRKDSVNEVAGRSRELLSTFPVNQQENNPKQGKGDGDSQGQNEEKSDKEDEKNTKKDQNNQKQDQSRSRKQKFKSKKLSETQAKKMLDQLREKDRELFRKFGRKRTKAKSRSSKDW